MKELSIEEKAKRYDEALKVLHKYDGAHIMFTQDLKEEMFPELKELEDDEIRKSIINLVIKSEQNGGMALHKWQSQQMLAWLEKQGGSKETHDENDEPKFRVGKWITNGEYTWYIKKVGNCFYDLKSPDGRVVDDTISYVDEHFHLWIIQDAKPGDVLVSKGDKKPFIFKGLLDRFHPEAPVGYCGIDTEDNFLVSMGISWWTDEEAEPATKEQRDLLFQKMKEAGYEWDAEKKELKKIEQKTVWSEEDDLNLSVVIAKVQSDINNGYIGRNRELLTWLGSIKDRVQPKQEWTEEDEKIRNLLISILEVNHPNGYFKVNPANTLDMEAMHTEELINWLRFLEGRVQPQSTWKPSGEQMASIGCAVRNMKESACYDSELVSLFNDLCELKEE